MVIRPVEHRKSIRFRKMDDFESYIIAIDNDYNTEDVTFLGIFIHQIHLSSKLLKEALTVKLLIT